MKISEPDFIKIMEAALDELPEKYAQKINNLAILVADFPIDEQLQNTGRRPDNKYGLLGLYEGYIQSSRRHVGAVLPDRITLFRVPIMQSCDTFLECRERIQETLLHEIAHHFGSDEKGARKAGKIRKKAA